MPPSNGRNGKRNGNGHRKDPLADLRSLTSDALRNTELAIESREALTERFLHEIEKEIGEALRMLHSLGHPWKHGDRVDIESLRAGLDRALTARKKERRDQLLRAWRDLVQLRERKGEIQREQAALLSAKNGTGHNE